MTPLLNYNIIPPLLKLFPFIENVSVSAIDCFINLVIKFPANGKFISAVKENVVSATKMKVTTLKQPSTARVQETQTEQIHALYKALIIAILPIIHNSVTLADSVKMLHD